MNGRSARSSGRIAGQIMFKLCSNCVQIMVKLWSNYGQIMVKPKQTRDAQPEPGQPLLDRGGPARRRLAALLQLQAFIISLSSLSLSSSLFRQYDAHASHRGAICVVPTRPHPARPGGWEHGLGSIRPASRLIRLGSLPIRLGSRLVRLGSLLIRPGSRPIRPGSQPRHQGGDAALPA